MKAILWCIRVVVLGCAVLVVRGGTGAEVPAGNNILWFDKPASIWEEALPVGNGFMGAMVYGGAPLEQIQFNEYTIWTGKPRSYHREGAVKALQELRSILQDMRRMEREAIKVRAQAEARQKIGSTQISAALATEAEEGFKKAQARQKEAENLAMREFMSDPVRQMAYQPCGDLWIEFEGHTSPANYRRWLDLDTAACVTEYQVGTNTYRREVIASYPDRAVVVRLSVDHPGQLSCLIRLGSSHTNSATAVNDAGTLALSGTVEPGGVRFASRAQVTAPDAQVAVVTNALQVKGATAVTIKLVAASSFISYRDISGDPEPRCVEALRNVDAKSWMELKTRHVLDHAALFGRVDLKLPAGDAARLPTNERLARFSSSSDPQLAALLFQYGRYLLIASSRPGGQPATLQGIWNASLNPPWDSKYTCNINTEMNYWPAEVANLSECAQPLFDAMSELAASGSETARAHYGARGWVLHHNFDIWRGTAPINAADHGIWVSGGAWLSMHLWEHYLFTEDRAFLQKAWPVMRGAALFFTDYLFEDPETGWLVSGPSNSPEQGGLVIGPTMDHQIVRSLFKATADAARILNVEPEFASQLDKLWPRIAPNKVGRHGQLQEWIEDKDDPANQHRHVSHLWGVFPGNDITWQNPSHFNAARQSLIFRGDAATGWSMGWKLNLWARFRDGDHAAIILGNLLRPIGSVKGSGGLYPNLFDAHPPFQIDGNFGATAGMVEMLLQSHIVDEQGTRVIELLPALPSAWRSGEVRGLRARGNLELDLVWEGGKLKSGKVIALADKIVRLKYGERTVQLPLKAGQRLELSPALFRD